MKKKTDRIISGVMFGGALIAISAFAVWRMDVNSPSRQKYVASYFEQSKEAEESKRESEKAAEIAYEKALEASIPVYEQKPEELEIIALEIPETTISITLEETATEILATTQEETIQTTIAPIDDKIYTEVQETQNRPVLTQGRIFTAEEENLLVRVASLEAGNQGWIGMALVMNVVLNRSATYNISIKDVIFTPRQFSVVGCEKWNNGYIAPEALTALQAVKDGWDGSQGALFFCSPRANSWHKSNLTYLFTGYGHEFYR